VSFESDVTIGVGQLLSASNVGVWGSSFQSSDTAIVFGNLPQQPASAIGLTPYPVTDEGNTGHFVLGIQVFMRAATLLQVMDLREAVRAVLNNRRDYVVGGWRVSRSWRQIASPQGPDENSLERLSDSYYFLTGRLALSN
jgi:hypothetical protein